MPNIVNNIFPPILNSTTAPVLLETLLSAGANLTIPFSIPSIVNFNNVGHLQVRIVRQVDNKTIVNTSFFPDGIIYIDSKNPTNVSAKISEENGNYQVSFPLSYIQEGIWEAGAIYKIQMRFGSNFSSEEAQESDYPISHWFREGQVTSSSIFGAWKSKYINTFSEWSNVMVFKPIETPAVSILNAFADNSDATEAYQIELSLTPMFFGQYTIGTSSKEAEDKYRFTLYSGDGIELNSSNELLEDSGWLQHNASDDVADKHRFKTALIENNIYTVWYQIMTINGYIESGSYVFMPHLTLDTMISGVSLSVDSSSLFCKENACCLIKLKTGVKDNGENAILSGNYVITRTSEKSNYQIWEDISYLLLENETYSEETIVFKDYLIESGIRYKYAFQQENSAGIRTSPLYETRGEAKDAPSHYVDFEYSYFYADGVQLKLMYNNKLSSFKHTVLESRQDTLGSKYTTISRNGYAYYAQFPIQGLISLHMDIEDQTFFTRDIKGFWYKNELIIPRDKYEMDQQKIGSCNDNNSVIETDEVLFDAKLNYNNIFMERKFREKVEEFLNNGEYKVFKSPTEGNIIVGLMDVSLTPVESLNRAIYSFSATAYEVMEYTLDNITELGILTVGKFEEFDESRAETHFNQISGLFKGKYSIDKDSNGNLMQIENGASADDLKEIIRKQIEIPAGTGYRWELLSIDKIWIEQYAKNQEFDLELAELEANISINQVEGKDTSELEEKRDYYEQFKEFSLDNENHPLITLVIKAAGQEKEIVVGRNRVYQLSDITGGISGIYLKYTEPIVLNYTCTVRLKENEAQTTTSIQTSLVWGQISGVFTDNSFILNNYNYQYENSEGYEVFDNNNSQSNNFRIYKTKDIFEVVKETVRHQVEENSNVVFDRYNTETGEWRSTVSNIYYNFQGLTGLTIETDRATKLNLSIYDETGSKAPFKDKYLNTTGKYRLKEINNNVIAGIEVDKPAYLIIDYSAIVQQSTRKGSED